MNGNRDQLQRRLRFLLPYPLTVLLMLGMAFMEADFLATRQREGLVFILVWEVALLANIITRWRCQVLLRSLPPGLCADCGYDLRASPVRCPECGRAASDADS